MARPGQCGIRSRKIARLVAEGSRKADVDALFDGLVAEGAVVRMVGPHVGEIISDEGDRLDADASLENAPGVLFDALVVASGERAATMLAADAKALEHLRDAYWHGKPLLFIGEGQQVFAATSIVPLADDPLLVQGEPLEGAMLAACVEAVAAHRNPAPELWRTLPR